MPAIDRSFDAIAFLSDHLREIVRRRLAELAGLSLITVALLGAIALATWSVQDPSFSHATNAPVRNLLGVPGAIFADLLMQLFGLASIALLLPEATLGWRLLSHKPLGERWRSAHWPLPTGLGGVIGDALLRLPAGILGGPLGGMTRFVFAIVLGLMTLSFLLMALELRRAAPEPVRKRRRARVVEPEVAEEEEDAESEEEDDEREKASVSLGFIVHSLLSLKARLGRAIFGAPRPLPRIPAETPA